jgi:hypothetical protein
MTETPQQPTDQEDHPREDGDTSASQETQEQARNYDRWIYAMVLLILATSVLVIAKGPEIHRKAEARKKVKRILGYKVLPENPIIRHLSAIPENCPFPLEMDARNASGFYENNKNGHYSTVSYEADEGKYAIHFHANTRRRYKNGFAEIERKTLPNGKKKYAVKIYNEPNNHENPNDRNEEFSAKIHFEQSKKGTTFSRIEIIIGSSSWSSPQWHTSIHINKHPQREGNLHIEAKDLNLASRICDRLEKPFPSPQSGKPGLSLTFDIEALQTAIAHGLTQERLKLIKKFETGSIQTPTDYSFWYDNVSYSFNNKNNIFIKSKLVLLDGEAQYTEWINHQKKPDLNKVSIIWSRSKKIKNDEIPPGVLTISSALKLTICRDEGSDDNMRVTGARMSIYKSIIEYQEVRVNTDQKIEDKTTATPKYQKIIDQYFPTNPVLTEPNGTKKTLKGLEEIKRRLAIKLMKKEE